MNQQLKASQRVRIIEYMRDRGGITSLEGINALNIIDTRKRISELRELGWNIEDEYVHSRNRSGRLVRFKRYWLGTPERLSDV